MLGVLGDLLPIAIGVTISPVPTTGGLLMILSARSRWASLAYLLGWFAGVLVLTGAFTFLSGLIPSVKTNERPEVGAAITIGIGLLLIGLGVFQWRRRPDNQSELELPGWMSRLDQFSPARAFGLALTLAVVNPKNFLLAASAGVMIRSSDLGFFTSSVSVAWFVAIGSASIGIPTIGYQISPNRLAGPIEATRRIILRYTPATMAIIVMLLGVIVVARGIRII
ncbi:MAG TPA: GAP family protein [Thermomicrobiales bacterium]|nr:GAP family protein [Thermomicrobiales bacterium]